MREREKMSEHESNYAILLPKGGRFRWCAVDSETRDIIEWDPEDGSNFLKKYMGETGIMITKGIWFDEEEDE